MSSGSKSSLVLGSLRNFHGDAMAWKKKQRVKFVCGYCGTEKTLDIDTYNFRIKQSKTGLLFCNKSCAGSFNRNYIHGAITKTVNKISFADIDSALSKCKELYETAQAERVIIAAVGTGYTIYYTTVLNRKWMRI